MAVICVAVAGLIAGLVVYLDMRRSPAPQAVAATARPVPAISRADDSKDQSKPFVAVSTDSAQQAPLMDRTASGTPRQITLESRTPVTSDEPAREMAKETVKDAATKDADISTPLKWAPLPQPRRP